LSRPSRPSPTGTLALPDTARSAYGTRKKKTLYPSDDELSGENQCFAGREEGILWNEELES
jgi:hypothetical protein